MKHIFFTLTLVLSHLLTISQINILWDDYPGIVYNGQSININKDIAGFDVYMHCQNIGNSSLGVKFRRVILTGNDSIFNDQFCDNNVCSSCSGNDWSTTIPIQLQPGDSSTMKPTFYFFSSGNVKIRYYVLDVNDNPLDSVDVEILNTVNLTEINKISILAYPNPVTDYLNIEMPNISSENSISVYNISGKRVFSSGLKSSINKLNFSYLKPGIYFYQISNGTTLWKSDKLILEK